MTDHPMRRSSEVTPTDGPSGDRDGNGYALVAEFDPARASVYRQVIADAGLAVTTVRDGEAARTVLENRGAPLLLVTDLSLPRSDGLTLIKHLRQLAPPEHTPVLVLSAFPSLRDMAIKAQDTLGITGVSEKNITPDAFREMVTRALALRADARAQAAPDPAAAATALASGPDALISGLIERIRQIARVPMVAVSVRVTGRRLVKAFVDVALPLDTAPDAGSAASLAQRAATTRQPVVVTDGSRELDGCYGFLPEQIRGRAAVPLLTSAGSLAGVATLLDVQPLDLPQRTLDALLDTGRAFADEVEARHGLIQRRRATDARPEGGPSASSPHTDPLTGLYTRAAGEQAIVREAARVRRTGYLASLALLDVDGFTPFNERHGREAGDHMLREIGRLLRSSFRQSDLSVRWGPDEFLIVLTDVPLVGAALFAERVRREVEELGNGSPSGITCSGGVVEIDRRESPAAAIGRAEMHLRAAKGAGGNRVHGGVPREQAASR